MFALCVVSFYIHADINECSSNPCVNGGTCVDHVNGYVCNCIPGYGGVHCQTDKYFCLSSNVCSAGRLGAGGLPVLGRRLQFQWFEEPLSGVQYS